MLLQSRGDGKPFAFGSDSQTSIRWYYYYVFFIQKLTCYKNFYESADYNVL